MSEVQKSYVIWDSGVTGEYRSGPYIRHRSEHLGKTPRGSSPEYHPIYRYLPRWQLSGPISPGDLSKREIQKIIDKAKTQWGCHACRACGGPGRPEIEGDIIELTSTKKLTDTEELTDVTNMRHAYRVLKGKPCQGRTEIKL